MLTNSERRVLIFIVIVLVVGSLAGFLREEPPRAEIKSSPFPINVNTATRKELVLLPYIGEVIAERIIEYRRKNEGFKTKKEILKIKGIGKIKFEKIKDKIYVEKPEEVKEDRSNESHE